MLPATGELISCLTEVLVALRRFPAGEAAGVNAAEMIEAEQ